MITLKKLEEAVGIRRQMEALEKRLSSLLETSASRLRGQEGGKKMSAATRAKIAAATRARWAKRKGTTVKSKKGGLTPAGRKRLSQLMKARWAAKRKAAQKK
jgi:hypothetical protein